MEELIKEIIRNLGEDPDREGMRHTPERYVKTLEFLTSGYGKDPEKLINGAIFEVPYDEMVTLRDIDFYSLCEHHLMPFFGKVHMAYLPKGKIIGLSKIPRIVEVYTRRLQVQERMTMQIAECLQQHLQPLGVAVVIEAFHLCMAMRGVEKQNCRCLTSAMLGAFRKSPKTRNEFMKLITAAPTTLTH
jgi:GTP cyclohydrolase I